MTVQARMADDPKTRLGHSTQERGPGEAATEHRLVARLYADVRRHGLLTAEDPDEARRPVAACQAMVADVVATYGGHVSDVRDHGLLATFLAVPAAVRCAVEIQHRTRLGNAGLPPPRRLEVRIAIELGDEAADDGRLPGGLGVAARIQAFAAPGGICLSESALDRAAPLIVPCQYVGERTVDSGGRPVRIYQIRAGCGE